MTPTPTGAGPRAAFAAVVAAGVLAAGCSPAAALDEADRCYLDKLRASRRVVAAQLACRPSIAGDDARRQRCTDRARRRARRLLWRAEDRATRAGFVCPAGAEALAVAGPQPWPVRLLDEVTAGGSRACRAARAGLLRRFAGRTSRCAEGQYPGAAVDATSFDACLHRARTVFAADWVDLSASPEGASCPASASGDVSVQVEMEVLESASRLFVTCGDGHAAGFEQCDDGNLAGGDGCSSQCQLETCRRVGSTVHCAVCPPDAVPEDGGCRCPDGWVGEPGACIDVDECAARAGDCPEGRSCVNLPGTWACAIPCTADAFHEALASCGAPSGAIAFQCVDTVIRLPAGAAGRPRDVHCDGLVVDGAGRGITFELDPLCWRLPVPEEQCPGGREEDGTCLCPDVDSGDVFVALRGDGNTVRDLAVRGFFDGIPARGRDNVVEDVRFERLCDDAFGSVATGVGNVFRRLSVRDGCDKCSQNDASPAGTDPDPRLAAHYNAVLSDIDFDGCRTPVRVTSAGRYRLEDLTVRSGEGLFTCDGPRFSSGNGPLLLELRRSSFEGCRRGLRLGQGVEAVLADTRVAFSELRGLRLAGGAVALVEGSTFELNGGGGSAEPGFGGVAVVDDSRVDLGGGLLRIDGRWRSSLGQNSFCGNVGPDGTGREVDNRSGLAAAAWGNWWCEDASPASRFSGPVLFEPGLDRAPLGGRLSPAVDYITAK